MTTSVNAVGIPLNGYTGSGNFVGSDSPVLTGTTSVANFSSAPSASQSASLIMGAAYQNTFGYDVMLTVYLSVTAATAGNILLGVDSSASPGQQTIISSLTLGTLEIIAINIYLPNNYYALLSTTGTISQTISGQIAIPI